MDGGQAWLRLRGRAALTISPGASIGWGCSFWLPSFFSFYHLVDRESGTRHDESQGFSSTSIGVFIVHCALTKLFSRLETVWRRQRKG
jgi:hypothetical protein